MADFPLTAFGELAVAYKTPQLQVSFDTHIDTTQWHIVTTGDVDAAQGLATLVRGEARLSSNGKAGGGAQISTIERAHYHPGQGIVIQFSGEYDEGVVGNTMLIGYGDSNNGFYVGTDNSDGEFGFMVRSDVVSGSPTDTWFKQSEWNNDKMDGTGTSTMTLDPTKANVYIVKAQLHYMGKIQLYVVSPGHPAPLLVHTVRHPNVATGMTIQTASLPLTILSQNDEGVTVNKTVRSASMAVFIEGVERHGRRKFSHDHYRPAVSTAEEVLFTLRLKDAILGNANHGHVMINKISAGSASTGDDTGVIRVYRDMRLFERDVAGGGYTHYDPVYTSVHSCSLVEVAEDTTTANTVRPLLLTESVKLTGTISATAGDPVHQFEIADVNGDGDRLAGCILHIMDGGSVNERVRRVATSVDDSPTTVTVAALDLDPDGKTAHIHNGMKVGSWVMGKDTAFVTSLADDDIIHLSPGETLTFTMQTNKGVHDTAITVDWIEKF